MRYCGNCGRALSGLGLRCRDCSTFMPTVWIHAAAVALLATVWWTHHYYTALFVPELAKSLNSLGADVSLPMRIHVAVMNPILQLGLPVIAAILLVLLLLRNTVRVPFFIGSGAAILIVACGVTVWHLVGLFAGTLAVFSPISRLS